MGPEIVEKAAKRGLGDLFFTREGPSGRQRTKPRSRIRDSSNAESLTGAILMIIDRSEKGVRLAVRREKGRTSPSNDCSGRLTDPVNG